jgi:hypothetical protein
MSERNIERIVKKYADLTREKHPDLPDPVYPHMFRRTRGTGLYRDGVAIEAIAVAMGHASIQTTKDHYAFPSLEQKKDVMNKGNGLVISKNETEKDRKATVKLTNTERGYSTEVIINQEYKQFFSIDPTEIVVPESGGEIEVNVETNVDYTISIPDSWIKVGEKKEVEKYY